MLTKSFISVDILTVKEIYFLAQTVMKSFGFNEFKCAHSCSFSKKLCPGKHAVSV